MTYRYYLTQRPPSPGAQPKGFIAMEDYGVRKPLSNGKLAWGHVDYKEKLTKGQVTEYELKYGGQLHE